MLPADQEEDCSANKNLELESDEPAGGPEKVWVFLGMDNSATSLKVGGVIGALPNLDYG